MRSIRAHGVLLTAWLCLSGCGGDDDSALTAACERSCQRTAKCFDEDEPGSGAEIAASCKKTCANPKATAEGRCVTVAKIDACLAKTTCDQYLGCAAEASECSAADAGAAGGGGGGGSGGGGGAGGGGAGGTSAQAGTSGSGPILIGSLAGELAKVVCDRQFDCCTADELGAATKAECVSETRVLFALGFSALETSVDAKRARYHADRARTCIDDIRKLSCNANAAGTSSELCESVIEGLVALGGTCEQSAECPAAAACFEDAGGAGKCRALPKQGQPCLDSECADGLICDDTSDTCRPLKDVGAACTDDLECKSETCANGKCVLVCDGK